MSKWLKIFLTIISLLCVLTAISCAENSNDVTGDNCDGGHNYKNGVCSVCEAIDGGDVEYEYDADSKTYGVKGLIEGSYATKITVLDEYNDGVNGKKIVTYVAPNAFDGNRFIKEVNLPATVQKLGKSAFAECRGLEILDIRGVTELESSDTFINNLSLKYVIVSDTLICNSRQFDTGDNDRQPITDVLVWGTGLYMSDFRITFHPDVNALLTGNVYYYTDESELRCGLWNYDESGQVKILEHEYNGEVCKKCGATDPGDLVYLYDSTNSQYIVAGHRKGFNEKTLVIPEVFYDGIHSSYYVQEVGIKAFIGVSVIEKLILPSTMSYLGDCSFYGCSNLEFVDMGGMQTIGREPLQVFTECKKLTKLLVEANFTMLDFNIVYFTITSYKDRSECRIMDFYVKASSKSECSVFLNHPMKELHLNTSSNMFNEVYMFSETSKENTWHYDAEGVPTLWNS